MRILIADDHPIVRHGLKQMLASDPAATVVGEATNGDEALELARKGGSVNLFAGFAGRGPSQVSANLIHYKELVVTGTSNSRRAEFQVALRLIETGRVDVSSMVTHRFALPEVGEAFATAATGEAIKVAVLP